MLFSVVNLVLYLYTIGTGCLYRGWCVGWGEEKKGYLKKEDCNQYKCFKMGTCDGDVCSQYENRPINRGKRLFNIPI